MGLLAETTEWYRQIVSSPALLRSYTAKVSIAAQRSVKVSEIKDAIEKQIDEITSDAGKRAFYVDDLDRATISMANRLSRCTWTVVRNDSSRPFFISDTPVVSRNVDICGTVTFGSGLYRSGTEWFLPISHFRALRIGLRSNSETVISQSILNEINMAQVLTMTSRLYGSEYCEWIDQLVQIYGGRDKFLVTAFRGRMSYVGEDFFDEQTSLPLV